MNPSILGQDAQASLSIILNNNHITLGTSLRPESSNLVGRPLEACCQAVFHHRSQIAESSEALSDQETLKARRLLLTCLNQFDLPLCACKRAENQLLSSFSHDTTAFEITSTKQPWPQSIPPFSSPLEHLLHHSTKMETWTGSPILPRNPSSILLLYHPWMRISLSNGTVQEMATLQRPSP